MSDSKRDSAKGDSQVRRKETPCYFCNEAFETGQLKHHLQQCGSILEQCPLRCGAWIQRRHKEEHVKQCPTLQKKGSRSSPTHARQRDPTPPPPRVPLEDCVSFLEREVASIKLVLTESANEQEIQTAETETLRSKLVLVEEQCQQLVSTFVSTRALVNEEIGRNANWTAQFKHDLVNVQLALQELQNEQLSLCMRVESCALTQRQSSTLAEDKLEHLVTYLRQTIEDEQARNAESRAALEAEVLEARRSSAQLGQLSAVREQLQVTSGERPAFDRLAVLEVATAQARAETAETSSKVDLLARDLRALTKSYLKMRSELADFQSRITFDRNEFGCDDGRFIWRIDRFTSRMNEAKEKNTITCSPLFRTSRYGYTLKAEVHLNGVGKWRNTHVACTVRVVRGTYDTLLPWPADVNLHIKLRDQNAGRGQPLDIVKSLQIRRKSPRDISDGSHDTKSSNEALDKTVVQLKKEYVFVPHTSLDKLDYTKNDVMFLEFNVVK